jgi:hypothetical protein
MKLEYTLKDFDKNKIISKFNLEKDGKANLYMSNRAFIRMQKYVPFDTGALSTTVTVKPTSVTYEQPYAHKQYVENKGKGIRGKYWDRKMWSAESDALTRETENFIKYKQGQLF